MIAVSEYKAKPSDEKKKVVKEFAELIDKYPVVGAVDVENLPAKQLMEMRKKLKGTAIIKMTKKRLLNLALDNSSKKNIQELKEHFKGMPALLLTEDNPFKLYSLLKKNKSSAPIKAGDEAPKDIVVPAGATEFAPGPIIGELGGVGIKAGVESGKVVIKEDAVVAKEGEIVSGGLAGLLQRLEIHPMEIGLNLVAVYENESILRRDVLDIDEEEFKKTLEQAAGDAFKLSIGASIPTKDNIKHLLGNAHMDAYKLADAQDIITSDNADKLVAKAEMQAKNVESKVEETKKE